MCAPWGLRGVGGHASLDQPPGFVEPAGFAGGERERGGEPPVVAVERREAGKEFVQLRLARRAAAEADQAEHAGRGRERHGVARMLGRRARGSPPASPPDCPRSRARARRRGSARAASRGRRARAPAPRARAPAAPSPRGTGRAPARSAPARIPDPPPARGRGVLRLQRSPTGCSRRRRRRRRAPPRRRSTAGRSGRRSPRRLRASGACRAPPPSAPGGSPPWGTTICEAASRRISCSSRTVRSIAALARPPNLPAASSREAALDLERDRQRAHRGHDLRFADVDHLALAVRRAVALDRRQPAQRAHAPVGEGLLEEHPREVEVQIGGARFVGHPARVSMLGFARFYPLGSPRDTHSPFTVSRRISARRSTPGPAPSRSAYTR